MTYDPHRTGTANRAHPRRSIRLQGYDYAQAGAYFVTICTHNRQPLFGQIVGAGLAPAHDQNQNPAHMQVNEIGKIANDQWMQIPNRFAGVSVDVFVVMPNHIHGIIVIDDDGDLDFGRPGIGQPQGLPLRDRDGQPQCGQPHDGQPGFGQPRGLPLQERDGLPVRERDGLTVQQPDGLGRRKTLGDIVGAYKSLVVHECLALYKSNNQTMGKIWQRNYYEHIIRDEESYLKIAQYILDNPAKWETDTLYAGGNP